MKSTNSKIPLKLLKLELVIIALAVLVCVVLALRGQDRMNRNAENAFLAAASLMHMGLEAYSADNHGCFPFDAGPAERPWGLSDKYVKWDKDWKIDYDAKDNGKGGFFVCMEFGGPYRSHRYRKLCEDPELRRLYGDGRGIPHHRNRIYVVREQAPIRGQGCP